MVDIQSMVNREKIKHLRKEVLHLTLEEAAARAGFATHQRWYAIESGDTENPPLATMIAIARVLGVSVGDLVQE